MIDPKQHTSRPDRDPQTGASPDPETLHTTDPQEHMKGPVSSSMQEAGEAMDTSETKDESDREHEEKL